MKGRKCTTADRSGEVCQIRCKENKALAIVVLSIKSSLLYQLEYPQDLVVVWDKLAAQFQKKACANKLTLRRRLYSLGLKESQYVQQHIKEMT